MENSKYTAHNTDLTSQMEYLTSIIQMNPVLKLNDLLGLIVRPNKVQITKEIYEKKVLRWKTNWPDLNVIPWN